MKKTFIEILKLNNYAFKIKKGKVVVTHDSYVLLKILTSLPKGIEFNNKGTVDLQSLTSLPEGTKFNNKGNVNLYSLPSDAENLGNEKRSIRIFKSSKGYETCLGCFRGTLDECINAIKNKYRDSQEGKEYIKKLTEAFKKHGNNKI